MLSIRISINYIFKKYIVDSRPYNISGENRMPSGHAQAVSYTFFS
jgi:hypothetical protein